MSSTAEEALLSLLERCFCSSNDRRCAAPLLIEAAAGAHANQRPHAMPAASVIARMLRRNGPSRNERVTYRTRSAPDARSPPASPRFGVTQFAPRPTLIAALVDATPHHSTPFTAPYPLPYRRRYCILDSLLRGSMFQRVPGSLALVGVALFACFDSGKAPTNPNFKTVMVTLGPAEATSAYRPSGLPATWSGFCPAASPTTVTLTAGDAYRVVNRSGRSLELVILPNRVLTETIAAGATGVSHRESGAVNQTSFTKLMIVNGCTDTLSAQPLFSVTVNRK